MLRLAAGSRTYLLAPVVVGSLFLLVVPWFAGPFYTHVLILAFLNITLAVGYRLLYVTGLVSFCHVAFYAIGAYASALLAIKLGLPFLVSFLAAGIMAAAVAAIVIWIGGRLKGPYFFLFSFAFLGVVDSVFSQWRTMTGGYSGVKGIPSIMGFGTVTPYYYVILAFTILTIFVMYRLDRSRFGSELLAIGDADDLAEVSGINVTMHRVIAFAVGALFAGFAGSMYAHYAGFVAPTNFSMLFTVFIIVWCVVGGANKLWGPIVGAAAMTLIAEFLRMSGAMQAILYGIVLLVVVMAMPHGIVGLVDAVKVKLGRRPYPVSYARLGAESLPSVSALPNMTNR
ncbi:MAG: branched-chain amino acid ABC transporter permease, partial [Chloroflexi bacterium]|nr:branched-chain amino acid ABC transporter permease [Chloroflexota bacterium]